MNTAETMPSFLDPPTLEEYYKIHSKRALDESPAQYISGCERMGIDSEVLPPLSFFERFGNKEQVCRGMMRLWVPIQIRLELNRFSMGERRDLEASFREVMAKLDLRDQADADYWRNLHLVHHLSVTADQAQLCRAGFLLTKV